MDTVSIAELESDLKGYVKKASEGEEVVTKIRNKPVAKIISLKTENGKSNIAASPIRKKAKRPVRLRISEEVMSEAEHEEYLQQLAAEGGLRLPEIEPTDEFWEEFFAEDEQASDDPPIPIEKLLEAVRWARDED